MLSKEKHINKIFAQIAGVPDPETRIAIPGTGIAEPGDLLFFITHHPDKQLLYKRHSRINLCLHSTEEIAEQRIERVSGGRGGKGVGQREPVGAKHAPGSEPDTRAT
jgi:hypothetical protein